MSEERHKETEFLSTLKMLAPGTPLREGLDNVLKAKTGGLIVIGDSEDVLKTVSGGFNINSEYSPSYVYELAKMDGAIIISSDVKRILYANTQLIPDPAIPTQETGTRHRTADRLAKQTNATVISISQRRNIITVYKGYVKYVLRETPIILGKANQAIQTLEKYRRALDQAMNNLSALEFEDLATLYDVVISIQRSEMVLRIAAEVEKYICELGNEGSLVSMQLKELLHDVETERGFLIKDYHMSSDDNAHIKSGNDIGNMSDEVLLNLTTISKTLGFPDNMEMLDELITPRGYRILNKIPRLPMSVITNLIRNFDNFQKIIDASPEELDYVEGIGEIRIRMIKDGLKRLQEQALLERHI